MATSIAILVALAKTVPDQINAIWSHCVGYPGTADLDKFLTYMKSCQLENHLLLRRRQRQVAHADSDRPPDAARRGGLRPPTIVACQPINSSASS